MASQSITTDPSLDITECDREPIHVPGSIQPHGLLLIADASQVVVAGAGDLEARLSAAWLGATLSSLIGQDTEALLARAGSGSATGRPVETGSARFDVTLHRAGD
ncbi:MAG: phytochrome, partial [Sphingomonas sp.]